MSVDAMVVIARCTRGGITSWQQVSKQLGLSVDAARCRYDPEYLHIRPWPHPCEAVAHPDEPIDENDTSSPHPKGPTLEVRISAILDSLGALSVADIACRLNISAGSARDALSTMRKAGKVENDSNDRHNGNLEWTWRLTGQSAPSSRKAA